MPARKRRLAVLALVLLAVLALVLLAVLALFGWLSRPARPRYSVTDLGVLPGVFMSGPATSNASGINAQGDVVGLSGPERASMRHAFLYRNGVMTDLGHFPLIGSHNGPAISDGGSVTGVVSFGASASGPGQKLHAFLYDTGGMHNLGSPLGAPMSMGGAINRQGRIAGEAWVNRPMAGGYMDHAFLYSGGRVVDIGILPGCTDATPAGINAAGQIVGYSEQRIGAGMQAFLYDSRTRKMTALAAPPGSTGGLALGINDRGQIIGAALLPGNKMRAVFWANGRATDLGALPGMDEAEGAALNSRGEAVGTAWSGQGTVARFVSDHPVRLGFLLPLFGQGRNGSQAAFLYRAGRMEDLNKLIPAHDGWALQEAQGINDRGQIVGSGLHFGQKRAFLLTPVR